MFKAREGFRKKAETEHNVDRKSLADKVFAEKFIHSD